MPELDKEKCRESLDNDLIMTNKSEQEEKKATDTKLSEDDLEEVSGGLTMPKSPTRRGY